MSLTNELPIDDDAREEMPGESRQFLLFGLNDETYGVGILQVHEIIEYRDLTVVPLMPEFVSGVINLRGQVVPVINLARRFNQQPREISRRSSIIIVEVLTADDSLEDVGVIVDNVYEVIELAPDQVVAPPPFGTRIRTDFIQGMSNINDQLTILLDINHVLAIGEISAIAQTKPAPGEIPADAVE